MLTQSSSCIGRYEFLYFYFSDTISDGIGVYSAGVMVTENGQQHFLVRVSPFGLVFPWLYPPPFFFPMVLVKPKCPPSPFFPQTEKKSYTQLDWSQVQGGIIYDRILYFYGGLFFSSCPSQQTYNTRKGRQEIKIIFKMWSSSFVPGGRRRSASIELLLLCTPGCWTNEKKKIYTEAKATQ